MCGGQRGLLGDSVAWLEKRVLIGDNNINGDLLWLGKKCCVAWNVIRNFLASLLYVFFFFDV